MGNKNLGDSTHTYTHTHTLTLLSFPFVCSSLPVANNANNAFTCIFMSAQRHAGMLDKGKKKTREQKELSNKRQREREKGLGDTHSFVLEILVNAF